MASLPCDATLNINISAYRVLFILLMLVRYRCLNAMELNRLLSENPVIGRPYNSETLTKYINTLREVGCVIPRSSSRNDYSYELCKTPFPLALSRNELSVADKLLKLLSQQSDECLYRDFRDFLEQLSWVADTVDMSQEAEEPELQIFPDLQKRREQMNSYRRYCQEAFLLKIQYQHEGLKDVVYLEPHEVWEHENRLFLHGYDPQSQKQISLDIDQIEQLRQMPSKNRRMLTRTPVVFALYGRLASSYRLYPNEKVVYRSAEELHVKTIVTDTQGLLSRVMKYGDSCQVLSPESFRQTIRGHIQQLLSTL